MCDELNFTMEKKVQMRNSPCPTRNNCVNGEKKSDYQSNKNGRQKKYRDPNNGSRSLDSIQNAPKSVQKYSRAFGDKRPRQRGSFDYRQSQEIAEPFGLDVDLITSRKAKGNANHLLNFSYQERGYNSYGSAGSRGAGSWGGRKVFRHQTLSYKKEQYLQASCQFIAQEDGDYSLQAIDPDALVDWDNVQLVRTFSSEIISCPICLDVPTAAKITRCGHTYCWGCILHYLQVNFSPKKDTFCPVCPERIDSEKLKSVQNVLVPEFKVGEEIEMKLMRKSKGSVFVCPEEEWTVNKEGHLNIDAGERTKFTKLLTMSWSQVQSQVIEREKEALCRSLKDAEPEEICFLQMAQNLLEAREKDVSLKKGSSSIEEPVETTDIVPEIIEKTLEESDGEIQYLPSNVSFDGSKITEYSDAFDEEESLVAEGFDEEDIESDVASFDMSGMNDLLLEDQEMQESVGSMDHIDVSPKVSKKDDSEGTPIEGIHKSLTPEEAADHLELPETSRQSPTHQQRGSVSSRSKDTYHFYQASTGQHIYMNSLNARCLTKEYGSLENSPRTIKATVVSIERIFMTEETRKRLRYLNHIPLTTEFHVVELKIKPPVLSKETIKHFQPEFDKRRKMRQRKAKEDKIRASKSEVEHMKAHGIYVAPEIQIPLDNTSHFPSHLASSDATERRRKESTNSDIFSDSGAVTSEGHASPVSGSPGTDDNVASSPSFASFAQKLQGGMAQGNSPPAWPRVSHSVTMPEMRGVWGPRPQPSPRRPDEEEEGEAYMAPSMASSWMSSLHQLQSEPLAAEAKCEEVSSGGKKKKKKKEKQLLFSTAMARKN